MIPLHQRYFVTSGLYQLMSDFEFPSRLNTILPRRCEPPILVGSPSILPSLALVDEAISTANLTGSPLLFPARELFCSFAYVCFRSFVDKRWNLIFLTVTIFWLIAVSFV